MRKKCNWMKICGVAGQIICSIFMVVFLGQGMALSAEKIAISTFYPADMNNNEIYPSLVYFKTLLEKKSKGAYEVSIFPGGQLGSEVETLREAQTGITLQMTMASSGSLSAFYKNYQAISSPYLFPDKLTAWGFFDSEYFAGFMKGLQGAGLRYLGTMDDGGGFVVLTNSLKPVYTPEDLKGMRIRTEENPAHMATMKAMGASVVPTPGAEVITALATKMAHGQFNAASVMVWAKGWEVQKYISHLNHFYNTITWVVSDKWFKRQGPEQRRMIVQCAREAVIYSRGIAAHLSDIAVIECKKHGMSVNEISPDNLAKFRQLAREGYRRWAIDEYGLDKSLLDAIDSEIKKIQQDTEKTLYERLGE